MSTFNQSSLEKGLATFLKLPAQQKRHDIAIRRFNDEVAKGTSQRVAIEHALEQSVKGLTSPKEKLSKARKAAGITAASRAANLVPRTSQNKTTPTKKIVVDKATDDHLVLVALVGGFIGLLVGLAFFGPLISVFYGSHGMPQLSSFAYWATLLITAVLVGSASYYFRARYLRHQLMASDSRPA
ncbi:MAG TPA: ABC transporter permease [Dongiaceae bacterium]|nr:ABC transporter permease [Dongiaceae bacterium]